MIGVIDYGAGNLGSVMNALERLRIKASFVRGPEELSVSSSPYEKIIFPGDGHFATAMKSLERSGYAGAIRGWVKADKPFLGICIGLQLLFESSEETLPDGNIIQGLSLIPGQVKKFPGRKIPQIGWNQTKAKPESVLFNGIKNGAFFYYIHSYYAEPESSDVTLCEAEYYLQYCSGIEQGALAAVQFHPEKSGTAGLRFLQNWIGGE